MNRPGRQLGYLCVTALALTSALVGARPAKADAVTDWNAIMQTTVASSNPHFQSRAGAIVHLAVFEAVNAIGGDYEPYLGTIVAPPWASPEAAAVAAAHRTLITLYPGSAMTLNAARTASLAAIPDGPAEDAGIAAGEAAASAMLQLRANDGSAQANSVPYTPGTEPGEWRPIPSNGVPSLPGWGQVAPFGLLSGSQFRLPPPPALHTGRYASDLNEVKLRGRANAPLDVRPQDRTDVARFFAAASPVQVWNSTARQVTAVQDFSVSENARNFALLAMAMGDASIASYETKYHYNLWRPQAAIWEAALDGNRHTDADPTWTPLIPTPLFPSYASAHATLSGSARVVLERLFGEHGHDFTLTNPNNPVVAHIVLRYTAFKEVCADIDDARVYGGIHFRFEQEAGALQGRKVGNYILTHCLRPAHGQD